MPMFRDLMTGKDGQTHDLGRWAAAGCFLTGLALQVYSVVGKGQAFDFQAFGIGCGAMAAGMGAMLKLKETTEPAP